MFTALRNLFTKLSPPQTPPARHARFVPCVEGLGERIAPTALVFSAPLASEAMTAAQDDLAGDEMAAKVQQPDFHFVIEADKATPILMT